MRTLHLFLLAPLAATGAIAQTTGYQGNLGGTVGISVPLGEFADTWGENTFTFGGQLAFPLGRLPFQGGFAFDYGIMGKNLSAVPISV